MKRKKSEENTQDHQWEPQQRLTAVKGHGDKYSQTEKDEYCMVSLMCAMLFKKSNPERGEWHGGHQGPGGQGEGMLVRVYRCPFIG